MRARQVAGFGFRAVLLYGLLMVPWPGVIEAYGTFYRVAVQFGAVWAAQETSVRVRRFRPNVPLTATVMDTVVLHRIPGSEDESLETAMRSLRSSRSAGYMPTALALALILATPVPWRRRAWALGLGFLLMTAFVSIMPAFQIYEDFEVERSHFLIEKLPWLEAPWRAFLRVLTRCSLSMVTYYIVPVLLWFGLVFRREDWQPLLERLAAGVPSPK
jgi:hypothetical protein